MLNYSLMKFSFIFQFQIWDLIRKFGAKKRIEGQLNQAKCPQNCDLMRGHRMSFVSVQQQDRDQSILKAFIPVWVSKKCAQKVS